MCLSKVYSTQKPDELIMEYVSRIDVDGDKIRLTDVMGEEKNLTGSIVSVDLTGSVVRVNCAD